MNIDYRTNFPVTGERFIELLYNSGLAQRRPVDDRECMEGMVANSSLTVTAWDGETLVGIARSLTDFHYACYVSDLAVDRRYQSTGIGKTLLARTQEKLGPKCKIILLAAPAANGYYEHLGFANNPRCWVLDRNQAIK